MLNTKFRATKKDIDEAIKTGKTISGEYVYAKVSRIDAIKPVFSIIVSKKVEKTSVGRHFMKRKISTLLEKEMLRMRPDFKRSVIIVPKKKENKIDFAEASKDLEYILKTSGFFPS